MPLSYLPCYDCGMPAPNILVVVVDGLRASALGGYGNTSFPTPALDRLAVEGVLFDWCFAPASDLTDIYGALLNSLHPARETSSNESLPRALAGAGYSTTFVTDDPELTSIPAASDFDHCLRVHESMPSAANDRATDVAHTAMARLFGSACDLIASDAADSEVPRLVWVHSRGMYGPWDAPLELQESLLDEGDPPSVESVFPPQIVMKPSDDPDDAFRYACAYAAQVMVLDECWQLLQSAIDETRAADSWLISLIGARGYPLGEHQRIGGVDPRLHAEQLHVPWMIRFPDGLGRLSRIGQLVTHADVFPTLFDYAGLLPAERSSAFDGRSALSLLKASNSDWRHALVASDREGARAIRTAEWCWLQDRPIEGSVAENDALRGELYVRPDDRWEANDVAKLCGEVADSLVEQLQESLTALRDRAKESPAAR
jgi:arylsulfatase A-like enzyme